MAPYKRRVALIDGCRTPFVKADAAYADMTASDLARIPATELLQRTGLDPEEIDACVFGAVIADPVTPNLGREVVLRAGLPRKIEAWTVNRACASSNQAITSGADLIAQGLADVVLAGGAEATSQAPIVWSRAVAKALMAASKARSVLERLSAFKKIRPGDLAPVPPAIAEAFTGLSMGESCEKMARENGIPRDAQDRIALASHLRAAAAMADGRLGRDLVPVYPPPRYAPCVSEDALVRKDTSLESLAALKPVFDRQFGTLTAGNSSPLTDGASAVLLMAEDKARALGYKPIGFLRSYAYAALDPFDQLLQGPAFAIPIALERAGATLADMEVVEMHEAFAAQVLSNLQALGSVTFARERLGRQKAVGEVDPERLNPMGGSIALGHPFGATGARLCMQLLGELARRGGQLGLVSVCAAGGIGAAMIWERE
ncbi:MAG: acetyl-CoA C-acyltransferase FadI [Candidatus Wallbacteria bacterium]|nr:acetyl-CoA C-acyltransferase FadI [Candidatus Wallbacteria bacterium]